MEYKWNEFQTPYEDLHLERYPDEVQEQFHDFMATVPYLQWLSSENRPRAKDIPRDENGRIIVDIAHPHILENMDYFRGTILHYLKTGRYCDYTPNKNPNSPFMKWFIEETKRCWYGYVRPEDGEWIPGDYYFFLNFCPMPLTDTSSRKGRRAKRVIGFPRVWEGHYLKFHYLEQARNAGHHAAELASRGKGKAHPYSQVVETPEGRKLWKDITIGSTLFTPSGGTTKVIDIPYDSESDIYDIILSDGRTIQATSGHLFNVRDIRKKEEYRVMSVQQMLDEGYYVNKKNGLKETYLSIKRNNKVEFARKDVYIDPYVLGLLIGDGCTSHITANTVGFTSRDEDMKTYSRFIPYKIKKRSSRYAYSIIHPGLGKILEYYGLNGSHSWDKHIPNDYKYNSSDIRLEILRGILDTDGTVNNNGVPMLTTTSESLCNDVMWLCRSLGYNCTMFKKQGKYYGKVCRITYNITIMTNDPVFKLERKLKKMNAFNSSYHKNRRDWVHIKEIRYSHKEMAKCVTVDSDDHCYLIGEFVPTHNSQCGASMLAKRFVLGEDEEVAEKVISYITASDKKYLVANGDQTLDKFEYIINFIAQRVDLQWPKQRITSTLQNMQWQMGYRDVATGTKRGTQNSVIGVSSKDDEGKLRGSRGVLYIFEEFGSFPRLGELYSNVRFSVEEGNAVYGLLYSYGTSGDTESDFQAAQEMVYNPQGYNLHPVENVYDKIGQGRKFFTYFFPGFINRDGCYNDNGVSDVSKALLEILIDRYNVKYHSTKLSTITRRIAEYPITPQEAMLKTAKNMFPVSELNERLNQILSDPHAMDNTYVGTLVMDKSGNVTFTPTSDTPITNFPLQDNKDSGALQIFSLPEKNSNGNVFPERYIIGIDPIDGDESETLSLYSIFVLDLWTDQIAAEYTGRFSFADDCHELARKLCLFYNAKALYENNLKGLYAYFMRMNCTHLLADTPEYLKDKDIIKTIGVGNKAHPYSQIVRTPDGIKQWGEVKVGDRLFGSNGTVCKVIDIPFDDETDIYEIELRDGRKVRASENHLWNVMDYAGKERVVSTKFLLERGFRKRGKYTESMYYLPQRGLVNYNEQPVSIDPYFMGLMLGDGCFVHSKHHKCYFTSKEEDFQEYNRKLNFLYKRIDDRHWQIEHKDFGKKVKEYGLIDTKSHDKFIPDVYKYNTVEVRLEVLRGLLDTNGWVDYGGNPAYCSVSKQLASDVLEVARSLGITCNMRVCNNNYGKVYKILFYTDKKLFNLERKYSKQRITKTRAYKIGIKSIKYVGRERAKCVTVDSVDSCYLIGDFVITHNSKGVNATAAVNNYANLLIRDWLIKPTPVIEKDENGEEHERNVSNLYRLKNIALIRELIAFSPQINVDRIRALGMAMLYREEKMIVYGGNPQSAEQEIETDYLGNDPFFKSNYDDRLIKININ